MDMLMILIPLLIISFLVGFMVGEEGAPKWTVTVIYDDAPKEVWAAYYREVDADMKDFFDALERDWLHLDIARGMSLKG